MASIHPKYIKKDSQSLQVNALKELQVFVDDATIERSIAGLKVKLINATHLDLGLNVNQINAAIVPIADASSFFTSTNVEGALQELAALNVDMPIRTEYLQLTAANITDGYLALSFKAAGTVSNNVLTINLCQLDSTLGASASNTEFKIMRNDAATTDYLVWKNAVTPTGCTNASSGIISTEFGDLLEENEVIRLTINT